MDRNVFPLPVTIEEIDREWITAALGSRFPEVEARKVEIVDVINGTCTKIRLRLDLNEAGKCAGIPETVILKGGFEPHSRDMMFMHADEVRAYRDVMPSLGLPVPACYFADYDPDRPQGIVIMEDLTTRGVTFCNPLIPQSHEQLRKRLSVFAAFHAKTWASDELSPGGRWSWTQDVFEGLKTGWASHLQAEAWERYMLLPRSAAVSARFQSLDWTLEALERMSMLSSQLPHCVVHGDTHPGNTYIDVDGTPGFFDPLPHRGPGIGEVTYHMVAALDTGDRKRWEGALIRHYLDELERHGVEAPAFDEAMRQYGSFLPFGYLIWVSNETFMQSESVNTAYTSRFCAAMLDHDTKSLLQKIG